MKQLYLSFLFCFISFFLFGQQINNSKSDSLLNLLEKNKRKNNDSSIVWGLELLKISNNKQNDTLKYEASRKLSYYYLRNRIFDSVKKYDELMLNTAKKLDSFRTISSLQNKAAYYNEIGLKDSAMFVLKTAQKIGYKNLKSKTEKDSIKKIKSILFIETAIVKNYFRDKEFEKALELTYSNLSTSNKYNITSFLAWNYYYLGLINLELGNYDEAEKFYQKELEHSKKQENYAMEGFALMHLGNVYFEKQDIINAKKKYLEANKLFNQNNYLKGKLLSKKKMFSIYEEENNFKKAIIIGEEYIKEYLEKGKLDDYLSAFYIQLGRVYHKDGKALQGDQNIKTGIDYASKNPNENNVNLVNQAYITYKELGNYKMALSKHEVLTNLKDSLLLNEKFTKQLAEANEKYESEKSKKIIAENNEQIAKQELEIKTKEHTILFFSTLILLGILLALIFLYIKEKKKLILKKQIEAFKYGFDKYLIRKYDLKDDELQLWLKITEGFSEKEIAEIFFKSIDTIKSWRKSLYAKIKPEKNKLFKQKHAIELYNKEKNHFQINQN